MATSATAYSPGQTSVVEAVDESGATARTEVALLTGAQLESGLTPGSVGDQGTSFGPFQIHLPAHPGVTEAEAETPAWAVAYMEPSYQAAAESLGTLWTTTPETAAEETAYEAERPSTTYFSADGPTAVGAAFTQAESLVSGGSGVAGAAGSADAVTTGLNYNPLDLFGIPSTVGGAVAGSIWGEVEPFLAVAFFVVAGGAMIVLGAYKLAARPGDAGKAVGGTQSAAPLLVDAAAA